MDSTEKPIARYGNVDIFPDGGCLEGEIEYLDIAVDCGKRGVDIYDYILYEECCKCKNKCADGYSRINPFSVVMNVRCIPRGE